MSNLQEEVASRLQAKPSSIKKRRAARRFLLQALYAWEISKNSLTSIEADFLKKHNPKKFDLDYFKLMFTEIPQNIHLLKTQLTPFLHLAFEALDPIERNILLIASYELRQFQTMPRPVIINEALELAKTFGATDSYKFINGALDKMVRAEKNADTVND